MTCNLESWNIREYIEEWDVLACASCATREDLQEKEQENKLVLKSGRVVSIQHSGTFQCCQQ